MTYCKIRQNITPKTFCGGHDQAENLMSGAKALPSCRRGLECGHRPPTPASSTYSYSKIRALQGQAMRMQHRKWCEELQVWKRADLKRIAYKDSEHVYLEAPRQAAVQAIEYSLDGKL